MAKTTKVLSRRRKFIKVDIPLTKSTIELIGNSPKDVENKTIKLDLTRQLKGKGVEAVVKIKIENDKAVAYPIKFKLMPYFIRRMIRKRISYVEDSIIIPSQESMIVIKPFLITRKRVSKAVRKTLRNKARNWIEDYIKERSNEDIFNDILSNRMQKPLSLVLKKTYPLSLCEVRLLEIKRPLKPEEVPKITKVKEEVIEEEEEKVDEKVEDAEKEIKKTQKKASEKTESKKETKKETKKSVDTEKPKASKKSTKTTQEKTKVSKSREKKA